MNSRQIAAALVCAIDAARRAGELMRANLRKTKVITAAYHHDIKLELDVRCQKVIEKRLHKDFPDIAVLGEEGVLGDPESEERWVVDPIDGTVNFTYGIPHACVSIALQVRTEPISAGASHRGEYTTVAGVIYDPFTEELWSAQRGRQAMLNRRSIRVSNRRKLADSIVSLGFAKERETLEQMLPVFNQVIRRARKIRLMGAAALAMAYVASGRFEGYVETGIRLWDIAAGGLILECAGGDFWHCPMPGEFTYAVIANNGSLRRQLLQFFPKDLLLSRISKSERP
jgi:myo-inositol-1(or 4)-monophosphatase